MWDNYNGWYFNKTQLGIISIMQKIKHQMENIIFVYTTQQKYTSLKYRDRSSQLSWAVEIMDVTEEAWLVFATRCQFLTPSTTWALIWHLQWSERKSFLPRWSKRSLATAGKEMSWNMRENKKRNFTALLC